jgi:hypothetical protein
MIARFAAPVDDEETQIEASFCEAIRNRTGAEVDFNGETRPRNLRRISQAKSEHVRRRWVPTTSLVTPSTPLRPEI